MLIFASAGFVFWKKRPNKPLPVQATIEKQELPAGAEISLAGSVMARDVVQVPVPIEGEVVEFFVEVGDEVYEGQMLARLRNTQLEAVRDRAMEEVEQTQTRINNLESMLAAARLEESRAAADASRARNEYARLDKIYQRQQMLYREGATPRLVFEKAEKEALAAKEESESLTALAAAISERVSGLSRDLDALRKVLDHKNQELEAAQQDLLAAEVVSPVTGIVIARRGVEGDQVNPSMPDLFQIAVNLTSLEVVVQPEPDVLKRLHPSLPAAIQVAEAGGEMIPGVIEAVREQDVVVAFNNPSSLVRPGLTAQVRIKLP